MKLDHNETIEGASSDNSIILSSVDPKNDNYYSGTTTKPILEIRAEDIVVGEKHLLIEIEELRKRLERLEKIASLSRPIGNP